jgi:hypothetical protein
VKNSKDNECIALMNVWHHIRQEHELASSLYPARPPHAGMLCKHFDASNDLKHRVDRGVWIVATDILLDRFQISASGARPL